MALHQPSTTNPWNSRALYLSRHFILVDIFVPTNRSPSLCLCHWNPCKFVSQGNQSMNFNKEKTKAGWVFLYFPFLKWIDWFAWETFWQDFSDKHRNFKFGFWLNFYHNETPNKIHGMHRYSGTEATTINQRNSSCCGAAVATINPWNQCCCGAVAIPINQCCFDAVAIN